MFLFGLAEVDECSLHLRIEKEKVCQEDACRVRDVSECNTMVITLFFLQLLSNKLSQTGSQKKCVLKSMVDSIQKYIVNANAMNGWCG